MATKVMSFFLILVSTLVYGCATGPDIIQGRVSMKMGAESHIDLGPADGVHPGDTLKVIRRADRARIADVGKVRVTRSLGKHSSAVEVLEGLVGEGDILEKEVAYVPRAEMIKGSVVMLDSAGAHIDLGKESGLVIGETLIVYREVPITGHQTQTDRVGIVRVTKYLDNKYSAVEVLEGSVREGDRVERSSR